jgi:hypothetical protein
VYVAKGKLAIFDLHKVLGHVSQTAIADAMQKGLIKGVEIDSSSHPKFCNTFTKAKAKR